MKYLVLMLLSMNCYAGFYIAGSKVQMSEKFNYPSKYKCEKVEKEACFEMPEGYNNFYYKLVNGVIVEDSALKAAHLANVTSDKNAADSALEAMILNPVKKESVLKMMIKEYMQSNGLGPEDI